MLCYYISHIGWYGIFSVLLVMLIQLHYVHYLISKGFKLATDLSRPKTLPDETKKKINRSSCEAYNRQAVAITREVLCTIKLIRLFLPLLDDAFYVIFSFLLFFGDIIFVSCNYATIKLYDSIPMPFFLTLPGLSCVLIIWLQATFPLAASVFENSKESLLLLKSVKIVGTDRVLIRTIRAVRPPRFNFGSMFYAKRSTKTTYFECWLNDTINALIFSKF